MRLSKTQMLTVEVIIMKKEKCAIRNVVKMYKCEAQES